MAQFKGRKDICLIEYISLFSGDLELVCFSSTPAFLFVSLTRFQNCFVPFCGFVGTFHPLCTLFHGASSNNPPLGPVHWPLASILRNIFIVLQNDVQFYTPVKSDANFSPETLSYSSNDIETWLSLFICVFVETGLVVMFGRAEHFSDCLGALCLLGSFTEPYTLIYSTFTFNRQIRARGQSWLRECQPR